MVAQVWPGLHLVLLYVTWIEWGWVAKVDNGRTKEVGHDEKHHQSLLVKLHLSWMISVVSLPLCSSRTIEQVRSRINQEHTTYGRS